MKFESRLQALLGQIHYEENVNHSLSKIVIGKKLILSGQTEAVFGIMMSLTNQDDLMQAEGTDRLFHAMVYEKDKNDETIARLELDLLMPVAEKLYEYLRKDKKDLERVVEEENNSSDFTPPKDWDPDDDKGLGGWKPPTPQ